MWVVMLGILGGFHGIAKLFLGFSGCVQGYVPLEIST